MPSVITIAGADAPVRRAKQKKKVRCERAVNPKTGRKGKRCFLGKTKKRPSGWAFVKESRR